MGLTLHVGARSSGIDRMLTDRWRAGGGLLVARDDHSLGQALDAATADGAVWGCRAGAFASLFGRTRELAGLPDAERRDGLALRCAITEALDPPGAGHVGALERLILELRAARATPAEFTAAAEAADSAALRTAARVYATVADVPSPDAPEWETVDGTGAVEIGPVYLVGFDDYAPVEWALLRALAGRNAIEAGLAYEVGQHDSHPCSRHSMRSSPEPPSPNASCRVDTPTGCPGSSRSPALNSRCYSSASSTLSLFRSVPKPLTSGAGRAVNFPPTAAYSPP